MVRAHKVLHLILMMILAFVANSGAVMLSGSPPIAPRSGIALNPIYADQPVDSSYVLGPGDYLDLVLENNYVTVQVYPDGSIAVEECGAINVGGKTLSEAREMILQLVSKRYKREYCFVQLAALKKFRVNVMGAVSQIGQQLVESQTRLSYFIRQIGGVLPNADTEDIRIIRGKDTLHIDYNAMSSKGDFHADVMLQQGDEIFVPFVTVSDNVTLNFPNSRTTVAYQENRTLMEYYELAGGNRMNSTGFKSICINEPGKESRWITFSEMKTTKVAPNTEVNFSEQEKLVYVGGAVAAIGSYPYKSSWHALDYISAAGVNIITGSWSQVKVWRGNEPKPISVKVAEDEIMPGDLIEIPRSRYETFKDFTLFLASLLTVVSSAFIIYANYNK